MSGDGHNIRRPGIIPAVLLWVLLPLAAAAAPPAVPDNVDYTLVSKNDSLTVWIDLARYFGRAELELMSDGIDYACEMKVTLKRPRRIWGSEQIAVSSARWRLSYRLGTEDFWLTDSDTSKHGTHCFFVEADSLRAFLADSVYLPVAALADLRPDQRFVVELNIARISLTTFNLATTDGNGSPVRYLFHQFLKATSYGREEFSTSSRRFSTAEIKPID